MPPVSVLVDTAVLSCSERVVIKVLVSMSLGVALRGVWRFLKRVRNSKLCKDTRGGRTKASKRCENST